MTRAPVFAAALAAAVLAAAAPAAAASLKHMYRAEAEDEAAAASRPASHAAPPADTSGPRYFDKAHESGNRL